MRFAAAAFRKQAHTAHLARPSCARGAGADQSPQRRWPCRPDPPARSLRDLARRQGARTSRAKQAAGHGKAQVLTQPAPADVVERCAPRRAPTSRPGCGFRNARTCSIRSRSCAPSRSGLRHGATFLQRDVCELRARHGILEIVDSDPVLAGTVVVCLGVWSAPLLTPFGFRVPLASGARLSHTDAERDAARRRAHRLRQRAHRRHAHGRPRARHEFHGVRRAPMRHRIRASRPGCATR